MNSNTYCDGQLLIKGAEEFFTIVTFDLGEKQGEKLEAGLGEGQEGMEGHMAMSKYYPASVQVARATMLLNLACAHSLRSEWDKARKCLKQVRKVSNI